MLAVLLITAAVVFITSLLFPPPLGREINFTAAYRPMPAWYFLWLYQTVRYIPGFIGTIAVPVLAVTFLISLPFIDKGTPRGRIYVSAGFILLSGGFFALTLIPLVKP